LYKRVFLQAQTAAASRSYDAQIFFFELLSTSGGYIEFVRDESSASNAADATAIPAQSRVTQQILSHWQPFRDLKLMFAGSRRAEQLSLRSQQRVVATVEESVLKTEMTVLESQEEDA